MRPKAIYALNTRNRIEKMSHGRKERDRREGEWFINFNLTRNKGDLESIKHQQKKI